jgi:hypothetical protein
VDDELTLKGLLRIYQHHQQTEKVIEKTSRRKNCFTSRTFEKDSLYFVPLGGSEQFGVNMNVYISGGKFLVVDCGMGFRG